MSLYGKGLRPLIYSTAAAARTGPRHKYRFAFASVHIHPFDDRRGQEATSVTILTVRSIEGSGAMAKRCHCHCFRLDVSIGNICTYMNVYVDGWMDGWMCVFVFVCVYVCMCVYSHTRVARGLAASRQAQTSSAGCPSDKYPYPCAYCTCTGIPLCVGLRVCKGRMCLIVCA